MSEKNERNAEVDATLPLVVTRTGSGGKAHHGTLLDPRAAMPGAVKHVGGDRQAEVPATTAGDRADLRRKYFEYVHWLAHPAEVRDQGNPVPALAAVFGISLEEAERRQVELHDAMTNAVRSMPFGETLRKKNAGVEARVARLAELMYSPDPKTALVATKLLNDMDEGATTSSDETIEDHIARLLGQ